MTPRRVCCFPHHMPRRAIASLMIFLGGCYGYYPATTPAPVGHDVQVTLSDSGSSTLCTPSWFFDRGNRRSVYVGLGERDHALCHGGSPARRNRSRLRGEHVTVPRPMVLKLEERRFSRGRTTLVAGAIALALIGTHQALGGSGFSFFGNGEAKQGGAK